MQYLPTLLAGAVLALSSASASANLLSNGSFESHSTSLANNGFCYLGGNCPGTLADWSASAPLIGSYSGAWGDPSSRGGWSASQGDMLIGLQNASWVEQSLTLAAGTYTLSWVDAGRPGYNNTSYEVKLDGSTIGSYSTLAGEAWDGQSLTFTVGASGSHTLRMQGLAVNADGTAFIDNMTLTTAVPEPGTASLGLAGLALLAGVARRRRQSNAG
ncbi:MAG: PEP-CTERM sorting domain-containing protein [Burkholderiales bacterium]|nr:PEP-CTERM sorting domain-containing protein [Burkholderiales bacterium]